MSMGSNQPPGWYYAQGDAPGTQRYWDGEQWVGGPQPIGGVAPPVGGERLAAGGRPLASPGQRVLARLIDIVIAFVLAIILGLIFGLDNNNGLLIGSAIIGIAYEVAFTALKGGTPGKLLMGLGVQTEAGALPPGWGPAVLRWVVTALPYIGFVVFLVSLVFLFTDAEHRTVGDRVARTRVVRTK